MTSRLNILLSISLLVAVLIFAGCDRGSSQTARPPEKVSILATVYPIADVARQVGGPWVDVSWVVEGGQSLSGVHNSSELRNRTRNADLVISGGTMNESWAFEGFDDPVQGRHIIRLDLLDAARASGQTGLQWLDPAVMQDLCRELSARLTVLRPKETASFGQRSDKYIAQIDQLVEEYQPRLFNARVKKVLVLSTDFNPLLHRFGLMPVLATVASPTQMSDTDWSLLKKASREQDLHLLLVPADTPSVVVRELEQRAGVQVVPIDTLGTSATAGRSTYLQILRYDLEQLANATAL